MKLLSRVLIDAALVQIVACRATQPFVPQLVFVNLCRRLENPIKLFTNSLRLFSLLKLFTLQRDSRLIRQHLQRVREPDIFHLAQKRDHISRFAATETLKKSLLCVHVERRRSLTVKRTQPFDGTSRTLQRRNVTSYHF